MADGTKATFDTSGWTAAFDKLVGPARVSLARSMGVAGGTVLRDEAKAMAPVDSGGLRDSIYLAFKDGRETPTVVQYDISWNASKAPHGHLLEFGHWQTRATYQGSDGKWYSGAQLPNPKWVPAHPFLRPAYDAAIGRARQAMIDRGRGRLQELLAGQEDGDEL